MRVQIYGARSLEDSLALVEMGLEHLGIELHENRDAEVIEILEAVRGKTTTVLLPLYDELERIVAVTRKMRPDIVHLCSSEGVMDVERIEAFAVEVAPTQVMQAIPVTPAGVACDLDSLALAKAFDPFVDYLLLDTSLGADQDNPMPGWVGVTGKTHDWAVSRAIVEQCQSPVILAGGLNPDNVAASIEAVRPWAVDANTGLNLYDGKKDLPKCKAFIERAHAAANALAD
jgi:phosphoribosylanthranilate isomerase